MTNCDRKKLLPVVEGEGDFDAFPILLRNILYSHSLFGIQVLNPPHKRGDLVKIKNRFNEYFQDAIKYGAAVIWVTDFDVDGCSCVAETQSEMRSLANNIRPSWPIEFVFMVKEYETLFLADPNATRKVLGQISQSKAFPANPETVRDAKGWLINAMPQGFAYKSTVHQAKITAALNFDVLRTASPSFAHLERAVLRLVGNQPLG